MTSKSANMYDMPSSATVRVCDREVLRIGIGGARWSLGELQDDHPAESILRQAIDAGITYIDTARAYTRRGEESHSEALIRRVLDRAGLWDEVVVATKGGHYRDGDTFPIDGSAAALRRDCERSLRALGRDRIDLYYLHHLDPAVHLEESVGTLDALRREGLIGEIGLCNVSGDQLAEALRITKVHAVQNRLSPFHPVDESLIEFCRSKGIAYFGYSPLASGRGSMSPRTLSAHAREAASVRGIDVETVLLAWLLSLSPNIAVVTGPSRPETLASSVAAATVELSTAEQVGIAGDIATARGDAA